MTSAVSGSESPAERGAARAVRLIFTYNTSGVHVVRQVNPIAQTIEAIGPGGRLQRIPRARAKGVFSAVVPTLADATEVVLWAGPHVELRQAAFARQPGAAVARRVLVRAPFEGGNRGHRGW